MSKSTLLSAGEVISFFVSWLNNLSRDITLDQFERTGGEKSRIYVGKKCRQEIFFTKSNTFTARGRVIDFSWKDEGGGVWKVYVKPEDCFYQHEIPKNN